MGWYSYNPKDVVRVYEDEYVAVDYNKSGKMYRVTIFEDGHFVDEFWFDEYKEQILLDTKGLSDVVNKVNLDILSGKGLSRL